MTERKDNTETTELGRSPQEALRKDERHSPPSSFLARYDEIRRALQETADPQRLLDLRDQAEALRQYIKTRHLGLEMLNQADELKLLSERRIGTVLRISANHGGDRRSCGHAGPSQLERWGISKTQSRLWRSIAASSDQDIADYVRQASRRGKEATSYGLFRLVKARAERERLVRDEGPLGPLARALQALARQHKRFGCIYADFCPAPVRDARGKGSPVDPKLARLPLWEVTLPGAHFCLKVAHGRQKAGEALLAACGFVLQASFFRTEASLEPGEVLQAVQDVLLVGVRRGPASDICRCTGDCDEFHGDSRGQQRWIEGLTVLRADSARALRDFIEAASDGPYLDLFGSLPASEKWTRATP